MTRPLLPRRHVLRGLGGTALAVPFLPSLLPRGARAASPARRFVFVGGVFGRDVNRGHSRIGDRPVPPWYPDVEPEDFEKGVGAVALHDVNGPDGFVSPIFSEAWDGLREKYTLVRGLDGMQIRGNAHDTPMALTGSGQVNSVVGFPYSVDAVLEESPAIYPSAPFVSAIRVCPTDRPDPLSFSFSSRTGSMQRLPYLGSPMDLYDRLFRAETLDERADFAERHGPVLNQVMDSYRRVMTAGRISAEDAYKLEAHLSLMSDIERALGVSAPQCAAQEPGGLDTAEALHAVTMDLEVAALACGMTHVACHVVTQNSSSIRLNTAEAHESAHQGHGQWEQNRWSMARVAEFIAKLDAVDDGDGSLLDHTVLMYGNAEARGFHNFYDMPVVLAGSPDVLRLGYYLDYRPRPMRVLVENAEIMAGRPYNGVLVTVLRAMGLAPEQYQRFGQEGFGHYDGYAPMLADHYKPFLLDRDATLPFLFKG